MNQVKAIIGLVLFGLLSLSCQKEEAPMVDFKPGKNRFTLTLEGAEREYYVHVPTGYKNTIATPVVIMFHGGGQNGELFYNISGWKEVGETENILTVFPSALSYCVQEDGQTQMSTRWNGFPGGFSFCAGVKPKDDLKFMREMILALQNRFKVDKKRIYMVGFSNGGQFSATCGVKLSDLIAAVISCGGGGSLPADSVFTPIRLLPTMLLFGNEDGKMIKALGLKTGSAVPMGFTQLYKEYPGLYFIQPKPYVNTFKLDEKNYTTSGDFNVAVFADYKGLSGNPNNVFKMVEVKGLGHEYPNGINHPIKGAENHWQWFKQFSLP